jgi:hypothetical protein
MPRLTVYVSEEVAAAIKAQARALGLAQQHYLRAILAARAGDDVRMAPTVEAVREAATMTGTRAH